MNLEQKNTNLQKLAERKSTLEIPKEYESEKYEDKLFEWVGFIFKQQNQRFQNLKP